MTKSETFQGARPPNFSSAFAATWPVMVGYLPMGMVFGILYGKIFLSFLSGIVILAGAAQFLSVKLFQNHNTLAEIWLSTLFLNLRHIFYSLHFASRYKKFSFWPRLYSIFSLTDETYAILVHRQEGTPERDAAFVWRVSFLNHLSWVTGCGLGAILKANMTIKIKGLDFFLVGLFVVLLIEQLKKSRDWKALGVASFIGLIAVSSQNSLWLFWAMTVCVVYGIFFFQTTENKNA